MSIHFIYIFLNIHVCTYKIQCESYSQTGCTFYSAVLTSQQFSKRIKNEKIHIYNVIDRFIIFFKNQIFYLLLRCFSSLLLGVFLQLPMRIPAFVYSFIPYLFTLYNPLYFTFVQWRHHAL